MFQPASSFLAPSQIRNLLITLTIHPDRHQKRDVADLAGPAALKHYTVPPATLDNRHLKCLLAASVSSTEP